MPTPVASVLLRTGIFGIAAIGFMAIGAYLGPLVLTPGIAKGAAPSSAASAAPTTTPSPAAPAAAAAQPAVVQAAAPAPLTAAERTALQVQLNGLRQRLAAMPDRVTQNSRDCQDQRPSCDPNLSVKLFGGVVRGAWVEGEQTSLQNEISAIESRLAQPAPPPASSTRRQTTQVSDNGYRALVDMSRDDREEALAGEDAQFCRYHRLRYTRSPRTYRNARRGTDEWVYLNIVRERCMDRFGR
jgi:hypothetical protein